MPVKTSPMPALAMAGLPVRLSRHWPSALAQRLPAPLSKTSAFSCCASLVTACRRLCCMSSVLHWSNRAASPG